MQSVYLLVHLLRYGKKKGKYVHGDTERIQIRFRASSACLEAPGLLRFNYYKACHSSSYVILSKQVHVLKSLDI